MKAYGLISKIGRRRKGLKQKKQDKKKEEKKRYLQAAVRLPFVTISYQPSSVKFIQKRQTV